MDAADVVVTLPAALTLVVAILSTAVGAVLWISSQLQQLRDGQDSQMRELTKLVHGLQLDLAQDYVKRADYAILVGRVEAIEIARARGTPTDLRGDALHSRPHRPVPVDDGGPDGDDITIPPRWR